MIDVHQRPWTRVAATAAAAVVVTTVLLGAGAGHAGQPAGVDCAAIVVDQAGVVDERRVRRAAQPVIDEAADVRVVTFTSVPDGDLDEAVAKLQRSCGLWSAQDGTLNDNMIVLAVSVQDRRSGLYYGASWSEQLLSSWPRIQARAMNPAFKEGDWTGGMVGGLGAVTRRIAAEGVHPDDGDDLSGYTDQDPLAGSADGSYERSDVGGSSDGGALLGVLAVGAAALAVASVALGGGGGLFRPGGRVWRGGTAAGTSAGFTAGFLAGSRGHHHHHGGSSHGGSSHGGGSHGGGGDGGGSSSF